MAYNIYRVKVLMPAARQPPVSGEVCIRSGLLQFPRGVCYAYLGGMAQGEGGKGRKGEGRTPGRGERKERGRRTKEQVPQPLLMNSWLCRNSWCREWT
jgi:hypothetical protein